MNFTPMDEKAYEMRNVWPKGWYNAYVSDHDEAVIEGASKNTGDKYFKTNFQVYNADGGFKLITTYIMVEGKAEWQMRSAAEALGLLDSYKAGTLQPDDLKGKSCWVRLAEEIDKTGTYAPKNKIADFSATPPKGVTNTAAPAPVSEVKAPAEYDDDMPF